MELCQQLFLQQGPKYQTIGVFGASRLGTVVVLGRYLYDLVLGPLGKGWSWLLEDAHYA